LRPACASGWRPGVAVAMAMATTRAAPPAVVRIEPGQPCGDAARRHRSFDVHRGRRRNCQHAEMVEMPVRGCAIVRLYALWRDHDPVREPSASRMEKNRAPVISHGWLEGSSATARSVRWQHRKWSAAAASN
jgi:hypothetical protein